MVRFSALAAVALLALALGSGTGAAGPVLADTTATQPPASELEPALAFARSQPGYAGAYYSNDNVPVFAFVSPAAGIATQLRSLVPLALDFEVQSVSLSLQDLLELRDRVIASASTLAPRGVVVTGASIEVHTNSVQIGIDGYT